MITHGLLHTLAGRNLYSFLDRQSPIVIGYLATMFALILGLIDYLTGFEVSFAVFYLIPVSVAAWYAGQRIGFVLAVISALAWYFANSLAGETFTRAWIPYWNTSTRMIFFLVTSILVAAVRQALNQAECLARTDALTGALNRRAFNEALETEIAKLERYQHPLTVLYLDLDNFKQVNSQYGHNTGDKLLQTVVSMLQTHLRRIDIVARLGGDEFGVLLLETSQEQACTVIAKVQALLLEAMRSHQWPVTFSIGAITCLTPPLSAHDLVRQADALMYQVKNSGKNAVLYDLYRPEEILQAT